MKRVIETSIEKGNKFAYGTGMETLEQALQFGNTAQTREQAEKYALAEYGTSNPSDNSSLDTLIEDGKIWIWDLSEELEMINTFDVHFNNSENSNNKGFKQTLEYCKDYIKQTKGTSYFTDYKGGIVSIVCNETGETIYTEDIV